LAKKAPPQKDWLDLNETIGEVLLIAGTEIRRHQVLLKTRLSKNLPRIMGDKIQLQQVILNLLMNAIEAMSTVDERLRELSLSSERATETSPIGMNGNSPLPRDEVLVSVRDSGPGLDHANLDRLFDAFYTTKSRGLGMGLAISRSIIEAHGGRLQATANKPRGAVFQFWLPITP
jgi:signal transduction histidine kinase